MKKNLRLLCLGLAAATFTCGFAQEDKTSSLKNADMELGLKGWSFDGTDYMGKNKKNPSSQVGFHGMNQGVQETWHSNPENPLGDSYVMQRVKGLEEGTYVFGAYVGAAKQTRNQEESNRDTIVGVTLFANDAKVAVATDNPDKAHQYKWAHSSKFNVATKVTDGTLLVGLKVEETTANYIVWDNATLYYFGDMDEEDALDAMAKIDMENAIAIADTLVDAERNLKMQVDSLENLQYAIEDARDADTDAASLWDDLEDLYYNMGLARRSITDYTNLKNHIEQALVVDAGEWTADGKAIYYGDFKKALTTAQEAYDEAEMDRAELTELRAELTRQMGWMRLDSFNVAKQALEAFINEPGMFTGAPGKYTRAQQNQLSAFNAELADTLAKITDPKNEDPRPQDLYSFIDRIYAAIENVKSKPVPEGYTEMPIVYERSQTTKLQTAAGKHAYIEGAVLNSEGLVSFNSPLYRFPGKVEKFRITVKSSGSNKQFFCLSELEFLDANGQRIELTEANVTSNADHNSMTNANGVVNTADGGGIPALFDQNTETFFHSAWQNGPSEAHYLEITLPEGGYDMFSFNMIARKDKSQGGDQHNFPGEMVINTPTPERDAMETVLNEAKALNPYVGTDPGFYTGKENPEAFAEIAAAIAAAEELIANSGSESAAIAAKDVLRQAINNYKALEGEKKYNVPVAGKVYRIISGFPGFFEKQAAEKALTVHAADTTLWWQNVAADSLQQEFMFEPILDEDGYPYVEQVVTGKAEDGSDITVPYYCYNLKNVQTGLYVDSAFVNNQLKLVETPTDTVKIKWLGRGQWNIMVKGSTLHCGDHNSGNPSTGKGAYGGIAGVSSGIVSWGGDIDGASAWFIREMPKLPLTLSVSGAEYKSDIIHFEASDSIILTADKDCAFDGLKLYNLYGSAIKFDVTVEGAVASIKTKSAITACAIAFNNAEDVASVAFDAYVPEVVVEETDPMAKLETKLEATLVIAPEQGTGVGQYDDISEYTAAVEAAEAMLENGAEADDDITAMIAQLDSAVAHLKNPHLPEAGKYYFIVSGLSAFEKNLSYNVAFYPKNGELCWAQENELDSARCWVFEPATVADLTGIGLDSAAVSKVVTINGNDTTVNAFYIKNYGNGEYMGRIPKSEFATNGKIPMAYDKSSTVPYKVAFLGSGNAIGLDDVVDGQRLHALGHGGGVNKSGNTTYWFEAYETASAWRVVEAGDIDFVVNTEIDLIEVEPVKVVKGIYDLFGRRLDAATAPGIYIINGVKRVVK